MFPSLVFTGNTYHQAGSCSVVVEPLAVVIQQRFLVLTSFTIMGVTSSPASYTSIFLHFLWKWCDGNSRLSWKDSFLMMLLSSQRPKTGMVLTRR